MPKRVIIVLPSLVAFQDGNVKEIDSFDAKEKHKLISQICKNAGTSMSDYYNINRNAWRLFLNELSA